MNRCKKETGNRYTAYTSFIGTPRAFVADTLDLAGKSRRQGQFSTVARDLIAGARSIRQISFDPLP